MRELEHNEIGRFGISTRHHLMENGERRFRLIGGDGSCYIRTEASDSSGWENSHSHSKLSEICVVQRGWVVYVELIDGAVSARKYTEGEHYVIPPRVPHNLYMAPHALLHTVKFGDCTDADWIASPELDALVKGTDPESHLSG